MNKDNLDRAICITGFPEGVDKDFFVDIFSAVGDIEKVILEKEKAILIFEDDDFDSDLALGYHESE